MVETSGLFFAGILTVMLTLMLMHLSTGLFCRKSNLNLRSLFWQVLKGSKKLSLSVRSVGRIPGGYVTNHVYTWVDPHGRSVSPPPDLPEHPGTALGRSHSQRRSDMQLLQDGDEKKVGSKVKLAEVRCHIV